MFFNNNYVCIFQNIKEWNQEITFDGPTSSNIFLDDVKIPTKLVEGLCFSTEKNLQFIVTGCLICNNVRFLTVISNKKNFTIICVQYNNVNGVC